MRKWLIIILAFLATQAKAEALTLSQVVARVRQVHPAIRQAQWAAVSAKAARTAQSWLEDPKAGIEFEEVPLNDAGLGNADMTNYFISQEIPFPGKLVTRSKALKEEYKARKAGIFSAERAAVFDAKKTYYELVAKQNRLASREAALKYYNQILITLEGNYQTRVQTPQAVEEGGGMDDVGGDGTAMSPGSDLANIFMVRMKQAEIEAEIHDLHHQHKALEARLNLLMGKSPDAHFHTVTPKIKKLNLDIATLEHKLLDQNSDLQMLSSLVRRAKNEVTMARQEWIPDVMPEFIYNQRREQNNAYTLGLSLNVPLWLQKNAARVRAAKAEHSRSQAEWETQKLNARNDLYNLWNHAKWHYQIIQKYQNEILPLARSAADTSLSAYQLGQGLAPDVLRHLIDYHDADSMYWDMWLDYQTDYAMLEQLMGEEL